MHPNHEFIDIYAIDLITTTYPTILIVLIGWPRLRRPITRII